MATNQVRLDKRELKKLERKLGKLDRLNVRVGLLRTKGGAEEHSDGISMVELGLIHEFGAPKARIPARHFIGGTFKDRKIQEELQAAYAKVSRKILDDSMTLTKALSVIGLFGTNAVRMRIKRKEIEPPNSPVTIAKKKSTTPLVDTGRMINAIQHDVEQK